MCKNSLFLLYEIFNNFSSSRNKSLRGLRYGEQNIISLGNSHYLAFIVPELLNLQKHFKNNIV